MQLVTLPLEILHLILEHTTKKEWKSLRGTNRFLHKLLTPVLFKSFNVYPHVRSFQYLIKASETAHIGPLIHELRYDARYLGVTDMVLRRLQSVYSATISDEDKESALSHARKLHFQALPADSATDEMAVMIYLEQAFAHLPNLQHIQVDDAFASPYCLQHLKLPAFYEQLAEESCGRFEHTRLERGMVGQGFPKAIYARALLMAMHKLRRPLQSFVLRGLQWSFLLERNDLIKHAAFWGEHLQQLKSLELSTELGQLPHGCHTLANLRTLLRPAVNLESLTLVCQRADPVTYVGRGMYDPIADSLCRSVFDTEGQRPDPDADVDPVRLTWSPKLSSLCLAGLICTVSEIKTILTQSATTLRKLDLREFMLMPDSLPNRACLVELMTWMQQHLKLDEIIFLGFLNNGGMQLWYPHDRPQDHPPESLLQQVYKFILKGGPNPLEYVAVTPGNYDLHKTKHSDIVPEPLREARYNGDESFAMDYNDTESFDDEASRGSWVDDLAAAEEEEEEDEEDEYESEDEDLAQVGPSLEELHAMGHPIDPMSLPDYSEDEDHADTWLQLQRQGFF